MTPFSPLVIGPLRIALPFVLAPMAGYTDLAYRAICRKHGGVEFATTEMLLDRMLLAGPKVRRKLAIIALDPSEHPLAGQLIGNDPAVMAQAAAELCSMGLDVIDLNFACPVNKALTRRRGGYLMRQPGLAVAITRAVVAAVDRPVMLKLRRSFFEDDRTYDAFWHIAEGAFDAGVSALCVHGRSVQVKYAGPADWEFLASVKQRFAGRTIIGSGDAASAAKAIAMLRQTGVDGVSMARGALGNPWVFQQIRDLAAGIEPAKPTLQQQRTVLLEHMDLAGRLYGPDKAPKIMRGFGIRYARLHEHPKDVRMAFVGVHTSEDWLGVVERHYADGQPTRSVVEPAGLGS